MKLFSLLSAAALAIVVATSGFANQLEVDYQVPTENLSQILAHDPNQPDDQPSGTASDHEMRIRRLERAHGTSGPSQLPPDMVVNSPHGCMEHGFAVEAEFLWWRAHLDDLEYALTANRSFIGLDGPLSARAKEPNFKYDPGVRVAAGYDFGRRNWDVFLRWTYHYTDPTGRTGKDDPPSSVLAFQIQSAPQGNFGAVVLVNRANVRWTNRLNALDFEMGYDYFFSRRFSIRPHMGLKAAWIDMHYRAKFFEVLNVGSDSNNNVTVPQVVLRTRSDYWGLGPRFGIDGHLHIGWGFSLYGITSAAMLYGQFDTRTKLVDIAPTVPFTLKQDNYFRLRTTAQMALGLRWGWCFSRKYFLALHIGWETQYWWNQLEMRFIERFEPEADLTYSGLDVGMRFDF